MPRTPLGAVPASSSGILMRGVKADTRSTANAIGHGIETIYRDSAFVAELSIARAMHFDSELIILDKPTNNLGVAETQGVLRLVRNARDSGHSCIFIAHNIHHVFQVVDRIVMLRQGRVVADDIDPKETTVVEVERVITRMASRGDRPVASTPGNGGG